MSDLYLDPTTGDLYLSGTKQPRLTTDEEEVLQLIKTRLSRWLGEWFADPTLGIPYRRDVLRKNPDLSLIRTLLRNEVLETRGVASVRTLDLDWDRAERHLSVGFEAVSEQGAIVAGVLDIGAITSDSGAVIELDDGTPVVTG